uniref:Uncharacterized protein n=1 Tax=Oryza meridionalis TaxID=40149 RepID=A0A0E0EEU0_9ORYZ
MATGGWPRRELGACDGGGRCDTGDCGRPSSAQRQWQPPAAVATVAAVQHSVGARGDVGLPSFDGRIHCRLGQILSVQQRMPVGWRHGGLASLPKLWVVG